MNTSDMPSPATVSEASMRLRGPLPVSEHMPSACPCCGAYSLSPDADTTVLLAVCDVLVTKAMEALGKFVTRADRSRFRVLGSRPFTLAHTLWQPGDEMVSRCLKNAWDVVPPLLDNHGCCGLAPSSVTRMLDEYVHDLAITGTPHSLPELAYRFESVLGLEAWPGGRR